MVTLPRDSVTLYATLEISCWISSEWYFLPRICFRPVTVFLMLEVICRNKTAEGEAGALRERGSGRHAHPTQRGLAVLALLVGEAYHAPAAARGHARDPPYCLRHTRRPAGCWVRSSRSGPLGHFVGQHVDATAARNCHHCHGVAGLLR